MLNFLMIRSAPDLVKPELCEEFFLHGKENELNCVLYVLHAVDPHVGNCILS